WFDWLFASKAFELVTDPVEVRLYHQTIAAILCNLSLTCSQALDAKSQSNHSPSSPNVPALNFCKNALVVILCFFSRTFSFFLYSRRLSFMIFLSSSRLSFTINASLLSIFNVVAIVKPPALF